MKKISIILLAMLPMAAGWAQDTVQSCLKDNYFMDMVPNLESDWHISYGTIYGDGCGVVTKEMHAKDSLKIYGVAACLMTEFDDSYLPASGDWTPSEWWEEFWSRFQDTTLDECYEYLGIYLKDSSSDLVPHREVMVHRKYDTAAYYVETGKYWRFNPNYVYAMYEKYFDSAIVVSGKFYVGTTQRSSQDAEIHMSFTPRVMEGLGLHEYHVWKYCWPSSGDVHWVWPNMPSSQDKFYLIFPILTPDPNAPTEEPGDTTGIGVADMVSRYVSVQPNPATAEVRVLSSFGIERVEVFNGEGQRVAELRGEGTEVGLDVRGWAAGAYLLRVATPMGTTTKKLLVR